MIILLKKSIWRDQILFFYLLKISNDSILFSYFKLAQSLFKVFQGRVPPLFNQRIFVIIEDVFSKTGNLRNYFFITLLMKIKIQFLCFLCQLNHSCLHFQAFIASWSCLSFDLQGLSLYFLRSIKIQVLCIQLDFMPIKLRNLLFILLPFVWTDYLMIGLGYYWRI